jgi:hypothetical protein
MKSIVATGYRHPLDFCNGPRGPRLPGKRSRDNRAALPPRIAAFTGNDD